MPDRGGWGGVAVDRRGGGGTAKEWKRRRWRGGGEEEGGRRRPYSATRSGRISFLIEPHFVVENSCR
jgi:hypothetical protein